MIILIGNQKGGAGKSTFTLLLANYLTTVRKQKVTILDMDYQQSIAAKAEKAKILENDPLYEVVPTELKQFPDLLQVILSKRDEIALLDMPGKMDDDGLIPAIAAADFIICPFAYDEFTVDSTILFALVVRRINNRAPLIFIPNRIKQTVKYETKTEVEKVISGFGTITPPIPDRIDFQRIGIFQTPTTVYAAILPVLGLLCDQYLLKKETL
ncbi:ParA family protein [Mucilaginibacter lacusdianchii]|uniref:ParA family protein n=1 Tax=Mucilaginibacter lacusdianchii TaxID=2684211 RepID=UPI00131DF03B|nr:ParA family protein [Mucilaginibacter sp. JXJ CY 39]